MKIPFLLCTLVVTFLVASIEPLLEKRDPNFITRWYSFPVMLFWFCALVGMMALSLLALFSCFLP